MPVSRMRMRPWLEKQIESKSVSGLTWLDKEKTMFSIPWKHAARHGWELDKDACLFKQWAIHTGKYVEGQTCDPKTWKANFRCAMNSLPDIEEVKDRSVNKGHQAVRVFRMLPASHKARDKMSKAKDRKSRKRSLSTKQEDCSVTPVHSQEDTLSTQESTIDSTVCSGSPDFSFAGHDVPDWSLTVEIGSDFPKNFSQRFEVSPEHNIDYDQQIIEICQQLEKDSSWSVSASDSGFLSNEACSSPGSQWSESSADDVDDVPHYTTLSSDLGLTPTDDLWHSFCNPFSL